MASPNTETVSWGDVVTTTLENRSRKLADNITNNNALLDRIRTRGKSRSFDGGREIIQELRYAQNQTFMFYSGFEFLNTTLNDTMTAARFAIKQAAISVVLSGLEELQNSGEDAMLNLIAERVDTAEDTFWNQMSAAVYSDGTGWGGKQIGGLGLLISKTPTSGVVGGIDGSVYTFWQNESINANTNTLGVVTSANIQAYLNQLTINLKRNSDGIDMIVADNNYYLAYLASMQSIQRVTSEGSRKTGIGFTALKYYGAGKEVDVILDGGKNGQIPTNTAYAINSDYLFWRPHSKRNYKVIRGDRTNINQDAIVRIMAWAGNMTVNNRSLQGVLWQ